jgi:hypothetical protein
MTRAPLTGAKAAEVHNLFRMRSYQARVIRQLRSLTLVFPKTMTPPLEERLIEE